MIALILGGGAGTRLYPLTENRSKPAVPLAGKYRLIDIPVSNCLNSGVDKIYVLTQFNSASLNRHIKLTYRLDHFKGGFVDILAAEQTRGNNDWFQGTADAVRQTMKHVANHSDDHVLILSGDQLYQMDYQKLLADHKAKGADISIATIPVTAKDATGFGIMKVDNKGMIENFVEKPKSELLPNWTSPVAKNRKTGKVEKINCDLVLSAAGVAPNTENIGLEELGIETDKGLVKVDEFYRTNIAGIYAIGDIIPGPALAHVATAEAILCVEKMAGQHPEPIDYNNIPGCTYCSPEIASVGYTEAAAKAAGYALKVGKFPFSASGKASAAGAKEGFVKVIFDAKFGEFLGAHMIGYNVTEMIAEVVAVRKLETTGHELIKTIHPHPTMSEAIMEAAAQAYDEVIHL